MAYTGNQYLNVPATGDLPGAWGTTAVNANRSVIDGRLGGFTTISLSSATTFALGLPTGASTGLSPGAGPTQSQNALLKFSGTLTGNAVVQFTMPGFYIVHNSCTVGAYYVQLAPASGTGNAIGAPPGQKVHVFFDGTDMDYVDKPATGSALDLHQSGTSLPAWITCCSVRPYLTRMARHIQQRLIPRSRQCLVRPSAAMARVHSGFQTSGRERALRLIRCRLPLALMRGGSPRRCPASTGRPWVLPVVRSIFSHITTPRPLPILGITTLLQMVRTAEPSHQAALLRGVHMLPLYHQPLAAQRRQALPCSEWNWRWHKPKCYASDRQLFAVDQNVKCRSEKSNSYPASMSSAPRRCSRLASRRVSLSVIVMGWCRNMAGGRNITPSRYQVARATFMHGRI